MRRYFDLYDKYVIIIMLLTRSSSKDVNFSMFDFDHAIGIGNTEPRTASYFPRQKIEDLSPAQPLQDEIEEQGRQSEKDEEEKEENLPDINDVLKNVAAYRACQPVSDLVKVMSPR